MKTKGTINDIRNAECTIDGIVCPNCNDTKETVYNQYGDFCSCQSCGYEWN